MRYHLTSVRMAIINKSTNKSCRGCGERRTLFVPLVRMHTGVATMESSMEIPQEIKNGTALSPSNSTSGNLSKETQNTNLKERKHPCVHCSVIDNHRDTEAA